MAGRILTPLSYDEIAKSYWREHESDDEHAERVEAATNVANVAYARACAVPLEIHRKAMEVARPLKGTPAWDRARADATAIYKRSTARAYKLFLIEFAEIMRDGETSEETSAAWDAYFAADHEQVAA